MRIAKKVLIPIGIVFIGFIVIQFIRPASNKGSQLLATDISKTILISDSVQAIIKNACYDCHSNNTHYPWYSNIQPAGWLMAHHIKKAKNMLNFSEFGTYSQRRQSSKLDDIANSIKDDIMPLKSYRIMHKPAQLSKDEKSLLIDWTQQSISLMPATNSLMNQSVR